MSDKPSCGATRYASDHGIACLTYPDKTEADEGYGRLVRALKEERRVDYILLAGYLKFISPDLVRAYDRAMLNIHPALLPWRATLTILGLGPPNARGVAPIGGRGDPRVA